MKQDPDENDFLNIIVVGYPKSGNTWLTRLVADLVNCPVAGFYNYHRDEIAIEGNNRQSSFRVYKAHHAYPELLKAEAKSGIKIHKVIYIIRDPRDVIISGAHYFYFERSRALRNVFRRFPGGLDFYKKRVNPLISPLSFKIQRMMNVVLEGGSTRISTRINYWLYDTWDSHVNSYMTKNCCLIVKYEDALNNTEPVAQKMLDHLGIKRQPEAIRQSIRRQEFSKKKREFQDAGQFEKAAFLRRGEKEQWRSQLSEGQKARINRKFRSTLERLNYPTV